MKTSTLVVRRATFKDGRVIERLSGGRGRDEMRNKLLDHAGILVSHSGRMDGFAIVAWFSDGSRNSGFRIRSDGAIGETMVPSLVHDILMRNICDPRE